MWWHQLFRAFRNLPSQPIRETERLEPTRELDLQQQASSGPGRQPSRSVRDDAMGHVETARSGATEKYLLGELGEEDSARYEQHFFGCGACAEDVEVSAAFLEAMRGVLDDYFADSPRSHWRGLFC